MTNQIRLEIRPAEGGDDASMFATELTEAITKHSNTGFVRDGKTIIFHRL